MNVRAYSGIGIPLSQLIFVLNEELRCVAYSQPCVAKVTQDPSGKIYRLFPIWRSFLNSTGILQLHWRSSASGETHSLPSAACRQKSCLSSVPTSPPRKTVSAPLLFVVVGAELLKHGALWIQLFLGKGEECVSTPDRAKGSPLDTIVHCDVPDSILSLISPRARQIRIWNLILTPGRTLQHSPSSILDDSRSSAPSKSSLPRPTTRIADVSQRSLPHISSLGAPKI